MWIFPAFGASTSRRDVSLVRKETPLDWDSESSEEEEAGFLKVGEIRMDQKRVLGKLGMWSGCCFSSWATKNHSKKSPDRFSEQFWQQLPSSLAFTPIQVQVPSVSAPPTARSPRFFEVVPSCQVVGGFVWVEVYFPEWGSVEFWIWYKNLP